MDQFVHVSETRCRLAGSDGIAHAVAVYARSLTLEIGDEVFVERIRREYLTVMQAVFVEDFPYFHRQVGEVSAVEPYAISVWVVVVYSVFLKGPYGVKKSAFKGVVGVYQEYEVLAQVGFNVCVESLVLSLNRASERAYETMSHSSGASAAEDVSGKDVRRAGTSGDYGSLGPIDCGPRTVCPSRTEFADRLVRGTAHSGCLGGHCHLVVHYAEHRGFEYLSLDKRSFHYDYRLVRKHYLAFAHSVEITRKTHGAQVFTKFCVFFARQELLEEFRFLSSEALDHLDYLVHAADYSPVVILRGLAVKQVEDSRLVFISTIEK